jgi:hypothetical protein
MTETLDRQLTGIMMVVEQQTQTRYRSCAKRNRGDSTQPRSHTRVRGTGGSSFLCSLFNNTISISGYIVLDESMPVSDELERMWKEAVMAYFKVLSRHFPGGTEENHEKPRSG